MRRLTPAFLVSMLTAASLSAATYTVTNTTDSGPGSLRQAIIDSNTSVGITDTIAFNVSGAGCAGGRRLHDRADDVPACRLRQRADRRLHAAGLLPEHQRAGSDQRGSQDRPLRSQLSRRVGVRVHRAPARRVRGLVIHGAVHQVWVKAANVTVRGCFIGTDAAGMTAVPGGRGVYGAGLSGASALTVGGPAPADRNLIAGHTGQQIWLDSVPNATIEGNLLSTDTTGAASLSLPSDSLLISTAATGTVLVRGNVVAGGTIEGINIGGSSNSPVTLHGNFIGTDATGTVNLGNPTTGLRIFASDVTVGGIGPGEGNVIAFNAGAGVFLYPTVPRPVHDPRQFDLFEPPESGLRRDAGHRSRRAGQPVGWRDRKRPRRRRHGSERSPELPDHHLGRVVPGGGRHDDHRKAQQRAEHDLYRSTFTRTRPAWAGRRISWRAGPTSARRRRRPTEAGTRPSTRSCRSRSEPARQVTATATDPDGNTSEFSQRIVLSVDPGFREARRAPPSRSTASTFFPARR